MVASALLHGQWAARGTSEDLQQMTAAFEVLTVPPPFHQLQVNSAAVGKASQRLEHQYPLGKSLEVLETLHARMLQPICPPCRTGIKEAVCDHGASTHILHKDA